MTSLYWENKSHTSNILRRIVELAHEASKDSAHSAKDSRRMAKITMQMAINLLDVSNDSQDAVESMILRRLAQEKEKRKPEGIREQVWAAQEAKQREEEMDKVRRSVESRMLEERELECEWQEAKYEALRRRGEEERRSVEAKAADAVKKAQDETRNAKREVETAREEALKAWREVARERQRADEVDGARRQQAAKHEADHQSFEEQQEAAAWSRYESQWSLFKRISTVHGAGEPFHFEDIPWPTVIPPTSPSMITTQEVIGFLFSGPPFEEGQSLKSRLKDCLLTWHPDKFSGRQVG